MTNPRNDSPASFHVISCRLPGGEVGEVGDMKGGEVGSMAVSLELLSSEGMVADKEDGILWMASFR
jgi:hypothetical protein